MTGKIRSGIICLIAIIKCCTYAQDSLYSNEFPLGSVKLLDGPFKKAQDLNTSHLLKYTVDRLLYCYRSVAGLPTNNATNYSNWAGLDGHVGGHYLSALAMNYAATGDEQCKKRMDYMIDELKKCQDANGKDANFEGFLCGMPDSKKFWNSVKSGNVGVIWDYWVPWYNIHKIYAGLRDAWVYSGSETAKTMFLKLCDWGINICSGLTDAQMQNMLGNEHGGVNEMYADAYQITNDSKYLNFAKRFSHKWLLDPMIQGKDNLDDSHANTQVPKAIGFQRIGEVGNDNNYYKAAEFFWTTVTNNRSIAVGGNSRNEFFPKVSDCMQYITGREGIETCNTNNMLKLTEGLFRMKPEAKYADFFERALFNHILSAQHPNHGGYVYFTPAHPRHYRVYSAPDVAMWCCVGTGMENPTKYGQFIYTHSTDSLFVNLFIASELDWKNRGIQIKQDTRFPDEEKTVLTINTNSQKAFKLCIRHPEWVSKGKMKVIIDTDTLGLDSEPSSYVVIPRTWNGGEVVKVLLPMQFSYEPLINVPNWVAIMRGPIVLAAKTGTDNLTGLVADASRMGHVASGTLLDHNAAPKLRIGSGSFVSHFKPVDGRPLTYKATGLFVNKQDTNLVFEPFFRIHDARYMMYWNATIVDDTPKYKLSVSTRGRGNVTRSSNEDYHDKGTEVTLTATPSEGWVFDSWSGDASGNQNPLKVTIDASFELSANFVTIDGKQDLLINGNYLSGTDFWTFVNKGGTGSGNVENGEYKLTVSSAGDQYNDIQLVQSGILLEKGNNYRLLFDARASANRPMNLNVGMSVAPYTSFLTKIIDGETVVNLTTETKRFALDFVMEKETYSNSSVEFCVGTHNPTVYIDNVTLLKNDGSAVFSPIHHKTTGQINVRKNRSLVNITINTDTKKTANLSIYDLKGRIIRSASFKVSGCMQSCSFNTADIAQGFYVVKIDCGAFVQKRGIFLTGK